MSLIREKARARDKILGLSETSLKKTYYPEWLRKIEDLENEVVTRKKREEEIENLKALMDSIINSMPSMLISVDPKRNIIEMNKKAEQVLKCEKRKIIGETMEFVVPWLKAYSGQIEKSIAKREVIRMMKIPCEIDRDFQFADLTIYPLKGKESGAVVLVDNVTEKVFLEQMMIQTEKMLSVGGLAAGMAHEINNPLAGIIQTAQVLRNRLQGLSRKDKEKMEEYDLDIVGLQCYMRDRKIFHMIESIIEVGVRAAKIVSNMLNFSRKSGGRKQACDVNDMLDETIELAGNDYSLKKKFDFRKIKIVKEYAKKLPLLYCEKGEIQQVVLNLLKNGAEALYDKFQRVEKEIPVFTIRTKTTERKLLIEIEDNGPGMDEKTRARIFEPFFTTKEVGKGTGLGLSVSYFIITENHGGMLKVESETGKGSCFKIYLPVGCESHG